MSIKIDGVLLPKLKKVDCAKCRWNPNHIATILERGVCVYCLAKANIGETMAYSNRDGYCLQFKGLA